MKRQLDILKNVLFQPQIPIGVLWLDSSSALPWEVYENMS
jgi:hypothetical protein